METSIIYEKRKDRNKTQKKNEGWSTREDEEDSRDKCQDGSVRLNVSDVVEDKTDEHEEEAEQRERSGWSYHLWEEE